MSKYEGRSWLRRPNLGQGKLLLGRLPEVRLGLERRLTAQRFKSSLWHGKGGPLE